MGGRVGYACPLEQGVLFGTWPEFGRLRLQVLGETPEPIIKGESLFETPPYLHGARPFPLEQGGSATGVLITDKSHGQGCDETECARGSNRRTV
jgi:hypothetical protein